MLRVYVRASAGGRVRLYVGDEEEGGGGGVSDAVWRAPSPARSTPRRLAPRPPPPHPPPPRPSQPRPWGHPASRGPVSPWRLAVAEVDRPPARSARHTYSRPAVARLRLRPVLRWRDRRQARRGAGRRSRHGWRRGGRDRFRDRRRRHRRDRGPCAPMGPSVGERTSRRGRAAQALAGRRLSRDRPSPAPFPAPAPAHARDRVLARSLGDKGRPSPPRWVTLRAAAPLTCADQTGGGGGGLAGAGERGSGDSPPPFHAPPASPAWPWRQQRDQARYRCWQAAGGDQHAPGEVVRVVVLTEAQHSAQRAVAMRSTTAHLSSKTKSSWS